MPHKKLPVVALVGQPNAGKSSLINAIAGKPVAVTSAVAGTTRDRQYVDTVWNEVAFSVVDTAGLDTDPTGELEENVAAQVEIALKEAAMVVLVVDGQAPVRQIPEQLLKKFRRMPVPTILAVTKLDGQKDQQVKVESFAALGVKPYFAVSSASGRGIGDMLDHIASEIVRLELAGKEIVETVGIAVSLVGKPNVGKSSLYNKLVGEERAVVSAVAGTTRTAVDTEVNIGGQDFTFIDTAGLKKKEHRQDQPDVFSGFQSYKSIRRSDVCLLVIDASEPVTVQDQRVGREIFDQKKGCVLIVHKADLYKGDEKELRDYLADNFSSLWACPALFVSSKTGQGVKDILPKVIDIYHNRHKQLDDEQIAEFLARKMKENPPKLLRDQKKPKVYGLRQIATNPPMFELLVNHPGAISSQFRKFVENDLIKKFDLWGTPITLKVTGKDKA